MFSILALFVAAFMAVFAVALPWHPDGEGSTTNSCNTGSLQCCDSSQEAMNSAKIGSFGVLAGVSAAVPVAVTCTPISALAVTGQSCTAQTACCGNTHFNGLVVLGCSPININP